MLQGKQRPPKNKSLPLPQQLALTQNGLVSFPFTYIMLSQLCYSQIMLKDTSGTQGSQKYNTYFDHKIHLQKVEAFPLGQKKYIPFQDWAVQLSLVESMAVAVVVQFCLVDMVMCLWWEL